MSALKVFPRRTAATPKDDMTFVGYPPLWWPEADEVHVSVTFTWDLDLAERLCYAWSGATGLAVRIGGPAFKEPGGEFEPGRYLAPGYVITSRGCPNHCWFCSVPEREGGLRELEVKEGWNVQDDNLLACSEGHVREVFAMLREQPHEAMLCGGLEAARLEPWHVELMRDLKGLVAYFAYDTPGDLEPLQQAGVMLRRGGVSTASKRMRAYVLIGYPRDTFEKADERIRACWAAGFWPFPMLYRDEEGLCMKEWREYQRKRTRGPSLGLFLNGVSV